VLREINGQRRFDGQLLKGFEGMKDDAPEPPVGCCAKSRGRLFPQADLPAAGFLDFAPARRHDPRKLRFSGR